MTDGADEKHHRSRPALLGLIRRLWGHLSQRRRRQYGLLFGLILLSAFAEVVSLGAVMPFLGVLISPERVLKTSFGSEVARFTGITTPAELILPLSATFAGAALIAGCIRMILLWSSNRLASNSGADLSIEIYRRTLYQPYKVHVARNSSEVISGLSYKVSTASSALQQVLVIVSSMVLLIFIMGAMLAINANVAIVATVGFGCSYGIIIRVFRKRLARNGALNARGYTIVTKAQQEGLGGIRDVLLDGTQPFYCEIYSRANYPLKQTEGDNVFIAGSPRFAMEAIGMTLIAALAYFLTRQLDNSASALLVLGTLALGAQRLLPALQQIYSAWVNIIACRDSLHDTLEFLDQPIPPEALRPPPPALDFKKSIRFEAVKFKYSSTGPTVLNGIDLELSRGYRYGFVGSTGSGKSTMLDLLMGLLEPTDGRVLVDDQPVAGERMLAWRRAIAHVPQSIYLADTSLAENIAFGVAKEEIDMERVRKVARQAMIADFIESSPNGYSALVGERGVRLSGGQRQRIGIARALYKQATVLVFDEATSSLDNATEREVMDAINGLGRDLTIIMVAHRLSTVKRCDVIVEFGKGIVVAQGTYDSLLEQSPSFRSMANANE
ncbi:MAG: ABC transporter ATP-binding protein [Nitrospinae bacterium]|nr:ABC transporter ATP-binding protein [Nitrospinota bacterium]